MITSEEIKLERDLEILKLMEMRRYHQAHIEMKKEFDKKWGKYET